jgi:TRAP-type transport system small permease protein
MGFLKMIEKLNDILDRVVFCMLVLLMCGMIIIVFGQVVGRFVFNYSPAWMEEMSRFLLIWASFIGAALMLRKSGHINVSVLRNVFPFHIRRVITIFDYLILPLFFAILSYYGFRLAIRYIPRISETMGFSMSYVYAVFPIAFALMFLYAFEELVRLIVAPQKVEQLHDRIEDPEFILKGGK